MLAWWKTITLLLPGRFGYFDLVLVQNLKQYIEDSPEEGMESVQTTVDCQPVRPMPQKGLNCPYLPSSYLTHEDGEGLVHGERTVEASTNTAHLLLLSATMLCKMLQHPQGGKDM